MSILFKLYVINKSVMVLLKAGKLPTENLLKIFPSRRCFMHTSKGTGLITEHLSMSVHQRRY